MLVHTDTDDLDRWRVESDAMNGKFYIRIDPKILVSGDRNERGRIIDRVLSMLQLRMHSAHSEVEAALGRAFTHAIPIPQRRRTDAA